MLEPHRWAPLVLFSAGTELQWLCLNGCAHLNRGPSAKLSNDVEQTGSNCSLKKLFLLMTRCLVKKKKRKKTPMQLVFDLKSYFSICSLAQAWILLFMWVFFLGEIKESNFFGSFLVKIPSTVLRCLFIDKFPFQSPLQSVKASCTRCKLHSVIPDFHLGMWRFPFPKLLQKSSSSLQVFLVVINWINGQVLSDLSTCFSWMNVKAL